MGDALVLLAVRGAEVVLLDADADDGSSLVLVVDIFYETFILGAPGTYGFSRSRAKHTSLCAPLAHAFVAWRASVSLSSSTGRERAESAGDPPEVRGIILGVVEQIVVAMILDDRIEGEVDMLERHLVLSGKEEGKKHRELAKWAGALESLAKGMANRAQ